MPQRQPRSPRPDPTLPQSPWPSREDRQREREAKREAVLATAVKFFNLKGFRATSLDDVALALGVTKPTIYHYFGSKDDILYECVSHGFEAIRAAAGAAMAPGGTALDRLRALLIAYGLTMTGDFGICVSRTADDELTPKSRAKFRAMKREIDSLMRAVIVAAMDEGAIAPGDARLVGFTLAGALNGIPRWFDSRGRQGAEAVVAATVDLLIHGLGPRGGI